MGARGSCAIAIEELHLMEVGGGPGAGIGEARVEMDLEIIGGSLAAQEDPVIVNRLGYETRGLFAAGLMFGKRVI